MGNLIEELDLRKEIVLDLKKSDDTLKNITANIIVVMDYSVSMGSEYSSGRVQKAVERVFPLAMAFDPDGKAPLYLFHDNPYNCGNITIDNISKSISSATKFVGNMGGTTFSNTIDLIVKDLYFEINQVSKQAKKEEPKGFFGKLVKMFSSEEEVPMSSVSYTEKKSIEKIPTLVLFFTDGDCNYNDRQNTEHALIKASKYPVFFQFIGIEDGSEFLEELDEMDGRLVDNANYFKMPSLEHPISDKELYQLLLKEFPSYITKIKQLNYI